MKKGKNNRTSTPGVELATSRSACKYSPHCATYALGIRRCKFSYIITYSKLKCPKHPFFQVQVSDHLTDNRDGNLIIRCCNIIAFLDSTRDRILTQIAFSRPTCRFTVSSNKGVSGFTDMLHKKMITCWE